MSHPNNPPPYSMEPPRYINTAESPRYINTGGATVIQIQPVQGQLMPIVVAAKQMGPEPVTMVCQSCRCSMVTKIDAHATARTHLWALCLFLVGCWPCMCIPYCMPSCMSVNHYCPNCNAFIGHYS